jgi:hypothetical protein
MIDNGPVYLKVSGSTETYSTISLDAAGVGYSDIFELIDLNDFSIEYKVACTGTPSVKLQIQERGSSGVDWVIPDNMANIQSALADKNQHLARLSLVPARYVRIKATELTETVDDTVITIRIIAQRKYPA